MKRGWRGEMYLKKDATMKMKSVALLIVMLGSCVCVAGQEKAQDRRKFLSPSTPVSDDPRRVPVKPGPMGPGRVLVLRGGRIFDGTGTATHEGTLVIERNKILKILPALSTDWPKHAEVVDVSGKKILPGLIDLSSFFEPLPYYIAIYAIRSVASDRKEGKTFFVLVMHTML